MNKRTPAEPPPAVTNEVVMSALAPGSYGDNRDRIADRAEEPAAEPRRSFFRGVAVGLAIMIPIWVWLAIRFLP